MSGPAACNGGCRRRRRPKHPYRDTLIVYGAFAVLVVLFAWLTGGGVAKAVLIAVVFFVVASAWSVIAGAAAAARAAARRARTEARAVTRRRLDRRARRVALRRSLVDPRAARHEAERALVGDRGAAADAAEQPRPRGGRAPGGARRVRRHGPRRTLARRAEGDRPRAAALGDDETLLVQSGKPVAVFRTTPQSPRVLIANSLLVPRWATWDEFRRLEAEGLTMFGQMTAGSWIYIGTQGILQGTYQTFAAAGQKHFGSPSLAGRTILTAGLGGMGGAQPLAATLAGAAILCVEVDPRASSGGSRRATSTRRPTRSTTRSRACARRRAKVARSRSACSATRPTSCRARATRRALRPRHRPDRRARSADRATSRSGLPSTEAAALRASDPDEYLRRARASIAVHVEAMLEYVRAGSYVFDYGNNLRGEAEAAGVAEAFSYPGFVPAYIRPLFCRGIGPFRWAALSGDPADIAVIDESCASSFPTMSSCSAGSRSRPSGSPSRACRRASAGSATATARRRGSRSTSSCGPGACQGAGRDRARPPRRRLGRVALPRDGGDAGRLRRDRRLADPERARQRGGGRDLGQRPSWRRRRHRQLDPCRHGRPRRRHRRRPPSGSSAC